MPVTIAEPVRNLVYACIAKRPEDRPASTAHLARAAQALRRGDVAGAIAAVPGVAGHDPISSFAGGTDTSAATRLLPSGGSVGTPPTATDPTPIRRRNPWTWPLIAIVSVLAVALIAIVVVLLIRPTGSNGPATPSKSSNSPSPSASASSATPAPTPTSTNINPSDFVGKPYDQVQQQLAALGYEVDQKQGPVATTPTQNGTVASLNPTGNVAKGKTIQVFVYQDYPGAPSPSAASGPASGAAGATVTITWPAYTGCPDGFPLSGYTFNNGAANGWTFVSGTSTPIAPAPNPSAGIVLSNSASSATISYQASCGSAGLQSPASNPLTITITG